MKRTISLLTALAFVLTFNTSVFAQSISAAANVITELSYSVTNSVDFANVSSDLTAAPTVNPNDGTSSNIVSGTPQVARVDIAGSGTESFNLSFPSTVTLSEGTNGDGNTDELTYTPVVSGLSGSSTNASGGTLISTTASGGTTSADTPLALTSGAYTLWFGGTLAEGNTGGDPAVETGSYSGNFVITINYN